LVFDKFLWFDKLVSMKLAIYISMLCLLIAVTAPGCGSGESKSDHTHLWTAGKQQHVWSYERVATSTVAGEEPTEPQAFLKREIRAGESLTFDGGAVVSFDGSQLHVGKELIKATNVHVERDGSIHRNAFIRASE
jgi:hypothetical protein